MKQEGYKMPNKTKRWQVTAKNTNNKRTTWDFLYQTSSEASMVSVVEDLTAEGYELVSVRLLTSEEPPPRTSTPRQIDIFDPTPLVSLNCPVRFWDGG
jgi:hypothetical protein